MRLERDFPYWLLLGASFAFLGLVFLAPWAAAEGIPGARWLYGFFAPVCHQKPPRSFIWAGQPLAVCARCVGLYAGFALGVLWWPWLARARRAFLERPRLLLVFFLPMGIDVLLPAYNTHWSRFITGWVAAFPVGLFVWAAMTQLHRTHFRPARERADHEWNTAR